MSQTRGFLLLTDSEIRKNDLGDIKPFIQLLVLATVAHDNKTLKSWLVQVQGSIWLTAYLY